MIQTNWNCNHNCLQTFFFFKLSPFLEYKPLLGQNAVVDLQKANHGTDILHNQIFKNQFFIAKDFFKLTIISKKNKSS